MSPAWNTTASRWSKTQTALHLMAPGWAIRSPAQIRWSAPLPDRQLDRYSVRLRSRSGGFSLTSRDLQIFKNKHPRRWCDGGEKASFTSGTVRIDDTLCPANGGSSGAGYSPLGFTPQLQSPFSAGAQAGFSASTTLWTAASALTRPLHRFLLYWQIVYHKWKWGKIINH
jgi:hypothetical protein